MASSGPSMWRARTRTSKPRPHMSGYPSRFISYSATLAGPMPRQPLWSACFAALLLSPAAARADVSSPGERIVASEVVFTGLLDFPAYHFVLAMIPLPPDHAAPNG